MAHPQKFFRASRAASRHPASTPPVASSAWHSPPRAASRAWRRTLHAAIRRAPLVKRRLAHAVRPAELRRAQPVLVLLQDTKICSSLNRLRFILRLLCRGTDQPQSEESQVKLPKPSAAGCIAQASVVVVTRVQSLRGQFLAVHKRRFGFTHFPESTMDGHLRISDCADDQALRTFPERCLGLCDTIQREMPRRPFVERHLSREKRSLQRQRV